MKDSDVRRMIQERDSAGLTDYERSEVRRVLELDRDELYRQCAERKAERLAERRKS